MAPVRNAEDTAMACFLRERQFLTKMVIILCRVCNGEVKIRYSDLIHSTLIQSSMKYRASGNDLQMRGAIMV